MKPRRIKDHIYWMGALDFNRRLFDALIPLPDGTSYNAYLIRGSEKTVLIDTVDPAWSGELLKQLETVDKLDFIVSLHAEQDHSGAIPDVLKKFPDARVLCSRKARPMLKDLLHVPDHLFRIVENGETLFLGDRTLEFIYTPWVHWPETMSAYLLQDKILFSCDFFGSHLASADLFVSDRSRVHAAAKRYFAEIMMPFKVMAKKNLDLLAALEPDMIAPSHGPVHDDSDFIISAHRKWLDDRPENLVVLPYISMHHSTAAMAEYLTSALVDRDVSVQPFEMSVTDIGKLAMALVDSATIVMGSPAVLGGPHPQMAYAAMLINALRPKARYMGIIGSYGWGSKMAATLQNFVSGLRMEHFDPVLVRGMPGETDFSALDGLADAISGKHREWGLF